MLNRAQLDRALGAIIGSAVGDALGAGYEFTHPDFTNAGPHMRGGGPANFAPGEWTDDTAMTWCILDALTHHNAFSPKFLDAVATRFFNWYATDARGIGGQTKAILATCTGKVSAQEMSRAAAEYTDSHEHAAGNGSLMRTVAVALADTKDLTELAHLACAVGGLTHPDTRAQQACIIWTLAIHQLIHTCETDMPAIIHRYAPSAQYWLERVAEVENEPIESFSPNGWVVTAFQAALAAHRAVDASEANGEAHFREAMRVAIGIGDDTDTVAAIAGALCGARWGLSSIPEEWVSVLHGYPGITGTELIATARRAVQAYPSSV